MIFLIKSYFFISEGPKFPIHSRLRALLCRIIKKTSIMKKVVLCLVVFAIVCVTSKAVAQDIPQNQVPSVILNHFQQNFSKASDVEWEKDWDNYKVEFETGMFGSDQEV